MEQRTQAILVVLLVIGAGTVSFVLLSSPARPTHETGPSANCPASSEGPATAGWPTYHGDNARTGDDPIGPVTSVHPQWGGPLGLDGQVYAEPLVCGDTVYVATEDDSVYAVNATTGNVTWQTHLGTPVPGASLPCGDISPSGITGTPVIDPSTGTLFVVAFLDPGQHVLFGLNAANGSVTEHVVADGAGSDPMVEQQRGALALANGYVYVPYGGLDGDCGAYHGWVVAIPTSGTGTVLNYPVPTGREGGIWGVAGMAVAPNGNLYVATGNSEATTTFDYGDAVIQLSPSLQVVNFFAPTNWAQLNSGDIDLGSVAPTLLPDGHVFQIGKQGIGYLLAGANLGGVGGEIASAPVCGGGYGGTAQVGNAILVPCNDGVARVDVGPSNLTVEWTTTSFDAGSTIVTGNVVWAVNVSTADLLGFNLTTGAEAFAFPLSSADHFLSPTAVGTSLFVAGGAQLFAFTLA